MKPNDQAANEPDFAPFFTTVQRYTAPVAIIGIVFTLLVIGWVFTL